MPTVTIRFNDTEHALLTAAAAKDGITVGALVKRRALNGAGAKQIRPRARVTIDAVPLREHLVEAVSTMSAPAAQPAPPEVPIRAKAVGPSAAVTAQQKRDAILAKVNGKPRERTR